MRGGTTDTNRVGRKVGVQGTVIYNSDIILRLIKISYITRASVPAVSLPQCYKLTDAPTHQSDHPVDT